MSEARWDDRGRGLRRQVDMRNLRYRLGDWLREKVTGTVLPDTRTLERGITFDQGQTGTCVAHTYAAWHNCKPKGNVNQVTDQRVVFDWYDEITQLDPWPQNDNDTERVWGTSMLAGWKHMVNLGLCQGVVWASSLDEISAFIRAGYGGVCVGTEWYYSMFYPTRENTIYVDPTSGLAGGHAWFIYGVDELRGHRVWVAQNSWGEDFADGGTMYFWDRGMTTLVNAGMDAAAIVQTAVYPS